MYKSSLLQSKIEEQLKDLRAELQLKISDEQLLHDKMADAKSVNVSVIVYSAI